MNASLLDRLEALTKALLGTSNKALSTRRTLRFGSKGSLAVEVSGKKRGSWFSHEAGAGGGPLQLICHAHGGSLTDAIAWARGWLGQSANRPRPTQRCAEPTLCDDRERQTKIADARCMLMRSATIAGTLAEKYLVDVRKIPVPLHGWPGTAVRYDGATRSLILAATLSDGTVQAVQRVRLGADAKKANDGRPPKQSRGPQHGALVRLPGDPSGPLLLAEGPETGLSVWRATGFETWVSFGIDGMCKVELPTGRRVAICADDDNRRAAKGKSNTAATQLQVEGQQARRSGGLPLAGPARRRV